MRPSPRPLRALAASIRRLARLVALLGTLVGAVVAPSAIVLAHAALDVATPADGATVSGTPPEIGATYTETLDPDGSSLVLVDANGTEIERGGVVTTTEPTQEMSIPDLPELAAGTYTVKSTTKSAADGDVDRTTWSFTVVAAPSPAASPSPSPSPTAPTSASPAASSTAAASSTVAASSAAPGAATPSPSGDDGSASGTGGDVLLPIIAGLAIVGVVAIALARRRGRTAPPA